MSIDQFPPILVDPTPRFSLSPWLYMQFMEPLGVTDGSVEAAWDHLHEDWRPDVVEATQELAPPLMRWGGCLSSYYRWREGVGARERRKPMHNLLWGGMESNQVGTHEFVDFCHRVGATPFYCVNFESDGRTGWAHPPKGGTRSAGSDEAAAWVDYCNNPTHVRRRCNGADAPFNLKLWQIGNETSYDPRGYDCATAARRTAAFARAMRKADSDIRIIAWGDSGWARQMYDVCGEQVDYLAFHNMFSAGSGDPDSPLRDNNFRRDADLTWEHLMQAYHEPEAKILEMREQVKNLGVPLALTECHFALPGRNRCEVLSTWAAGVSNARILNLHERNGDVLKIATLADFCGTRWQVNAIMIPVPGGKAYLMPVARVMALYRRHSGAEFVNTLAVPDGLDVTASRSGNKLYLHVINTRRKMPVKAKLSIQGYPATGGKVYQISADPELEIMECTRDALASVQKDLPPNMEWTFPAASVSAVELAL
jgi:alpha-L-arabinofuranosidase